MLSFSLASSRVLDSGWLVEPDDAALMMETSKDVIEEIEELTITVRKAERFVFESQ